MGSGIDRECSFDMLDQFRISGDNFLDTAHCYANWLPNVERCASEKILGRWLVDRGCRDEMIVATKGGHPLFVAGSKPRLRREEISQDLEESLTNLQVDVIDLYWLHRDDPNIPVNDILETLTNFVESGKIRYFGCSNWRADRVRDAWEVAKAQGIQCFVGDQMLWNLAVVDAEAIGDPTIVVMDDGLMKFHRETGMAAIPFSGQANGLFAKMAAGRLDTLNSLHSNMYASPENSLRYERVKALSSQLGVGANDIALGYLMAQPFTTIPIIGPRNIEQLVDSLGAAEIELTSEMVEFLVS